MDFVLNRRSGVAVRDQLVAQIELKILSGDFAPGQKLPSVRSLARRLKVHANTVSAAYQELEAGGQVALQRGAGVFVRRRGPTTLQEARGLDEMIRLALHAAFRKGYTGPAIRTAVERWLAAAPPDRIVVLDAVREMSEVMAYEVKESLRVPVVSGSLDDLARDPSLVSGALALALPYHVEAINRLAPEAALEAVTLEVSAKDREIATALPAGAIVLVVSHSPTMLPFASIFLRSLRGDDLLVETRLLSAAREWRRLAPAADIVFADALSVESVNRAKPRRLREVRVVTETALARLRDALAVVVPRSVPRS